MASTIFPASQMTLARHFVPALLAISAACAPESLASVNAELDHAVAYRACGPADGPAVGITIATVPGTSPEVAAPYLRVAVWQTVERLAGRSWNLVGGDEEGAAWFHETPSEFETPTSGSVRIRAVGPDRTIEGTVDVVFPKAGRIQRSFRAEWIEGTQPMLCG